MDPLIKPNGGSASEPSQHNRAEGTEQAPSALSTVECLQTPMEIGSTTTRPRRANISGSERKRRRKARLAKGATAVSAVPPQKSQPSSSTNKEGTGNLDPPAEASGSSKGAASSAIGKTNRTQMIIGPKSHGTPGESAQKRQRTPGSTPDAARASKRPRPARHWQAGYAQVALGDKNLQVVVGREGQGDLPFSEDQLLEFLDAVGEAITQTPTGSGTPLQFSSTHLWRGQLLVTAANQASKDWLLRSLNEIRPWGDVNLVALDPATLRLKRALLWVPGKKALSDKDTLSALERQNPGLACSKWKVWNRKMEPQGLSLVVGVDEKSITTLQGLNFQPYYSATRAQVTLTTHRVKGKKGTAEAGTLPASGSGGTAQAGTSKGKKGTAKAGTLPASGSGGTAQAGTSTSKEPPGVPESGGGRD